MAKGNLFQGMGRGAVGDVVFSRLNGQQVSRVRNRNPRNPRTNAQLYQRAIMATVMQAYSAGKRIFDHSFQYKSVGAENQREFMRQNAKLLRSLVAVEYNLPVSGTYPHLDAHARVVAPGISSPVGFDGMVISQGTYDQRFFIVNPAANINDQETPLSFATPAPLEGETYAEYASRNGLIANDYYTFVGFFVSNIDVFGLDVEDLIGSSQKAEQFFFIRLRVKDTFTTGETAITADTAISEIFDADAYTEVGTDVAALLAMKIGATIPFETLGHYPGLEAQFISYIGLIRSRLDEDLRSSSTLMRSEYFTRCGITPFWLLDAWKRGTQKVGDSDLILEGGDF